MIIIGRPEWGLACIEPVFINFRQSLEVVEYGIFFFSAASAIEWPAKTAPMNQFFLGLSWSGIASLNGKKRVWIDDIRIVCCETHSKHMTMCSHDF